MISTGDPALHLMIVQKKDTILLIHHKNSEQLRKLNHADTFSILLFLTFFSN